jgi:CD109 antigen
VSDKQGNLGSAELGLRAFQDFFVEPDLPRFLTAGDEIDVPVAVYNYLSEPQSIELAVTPADWFEMRGEPQLVFEAEANEVMAAYLPIRVMQFGKHDLQITPPLS